MPVEAKVEIKKEEEVKVEKKETNAINNTGNVNFTEA